MLIRFLFNYVLSTLITKFAAKLDTRVTINKLTRMHERVNIPQYHTL